MSNISFTNVNCVHEPMDSKYKQAVKNMADILTKRRQGIDAHTHKKTPWCFDRHVFLRNKNNSTFSSLVPSTQGVIFFKFESKEASSFTTSTRMQVDEAQVSGTHWVNFMDGVPSCTKPEWNCSWNIFMEVICNTHTHTAALTFRKTGGQTCTF